MTESTEYKLDALVGHVKKVRRWLVWLELLKVTAFYLVFISAYIGIYAWLDHRFHFGGFGRITALVLLIASVIYLLFRFCKHLISHISLSRAANYIESKYNFEQQLVAAIEYHEDDSDYPYSRELADELVKQVDRATANTDFETTVSKWWMYMFGAIIISGICVVSFFMLDNYSYFSRYFVRLTHPLAEVEPIPPTSLETISKSMTVEPDSLVTLSAKINGRVPEFGNLVLADADANEVDAGLNYKILETLQLRPDTSEDDGAKFEANIPFEKIGKFQYRFEVEDTVTPWQKIQVCTIPKIKKITATVKLKRSKYIKPYQQDIKDCYLEVLNNSQVTINVFVSENLTSSVINGLGIRDLKKELNGTNEFSFSFDAYRDGFIEIELTSAKGVTNSNVQPLQVKLKVDAPAKFKQLSPVGDYLATNVASIPLAFEVFDDFGLKTVTLTWEIAGGEPETFDFPIEGAAKNKKITRTLELEDYDLQVSDSIIYYASATDISPTGNESRLAASSDIYFIEVKPYREKWPQLKPKLPGEIKQGLDPDKTLGHDKLMTVLEYTRAFIKKTWAIAAKRKLSDQDRKRLDSIGVDVEYAIEQMGLIRDDPRNRFGPKQKATLNEIIEFYNQAVSYLVSHKPTEAMVPEKQAYKILRKFIIELVKVTMQGSVPPPPPKLDVVKMKELVHLTRFEKEREEWELNRLAQKLEKIEKKQEELRKKFQRFLEMQKKAKKLHQKTTDEKKWIDKTDKGAQGKPCPSCANNEEGQCPDCDSSTTMEGAIKPPHPADPDAKPKLGAGSGSGKGKGKDSGGKASMAEKLEMLQAKQKAMMAQVEALKDELKKVDSKESRSSKEKAQDALEEAAKQMKKFDAKLTEAKYRPKQEERILAQAGKALDKAGDKISEALALLKKELNISDENIIAEKAAKLAAKMATASKEMKTMVNPFSEGQLLQMLKETENLLEAAELLQSSGGAPMPYLSGGTLKRARNIINGKKGSSDALSNYFSKLAKQLWSVALVTKKIDSGIVEDSPSDAKFYKLENVFFENAARFEQ